MFNLTPKGPVITLCTFCFNIKKLETFSQDCISVILMDLGINRIYCRIQHELTGFYNWAEVCLLRGMNWLLNIIQVIFERNKEGASLVYSTKFVTDSYRRLVEWYLQGSTEVLGEKLYLPRHLQQIPSGPEWDWIFASALKWQLIRVWRVLPAACR